MRCLMACVAATLALALPVSAAENARTLAQQAKALVERRDAAQAYSLLEPFEQRFSGDVDFDYWFGVAALESDHLDRAVIAFERVLVRNPDFDSARLELARAYLRMGALDVAAQEFQRLLARAPNEQGRKLIGDYLAQIERLKRRQRLAIGGYVEAGGGRDTNLSSTTSDFSGAILTSFGLPGIQPTGNSIRRADNFLAASAGGDVVYAFSPDRAVLAAANVRWRGYRDFDDFDYVLGDLIGGYRMRAGDLDYLFTAMWQTFRQDGAIVDTLGAARVTNDRDAAGAGLEVRREAARGTVAALGVQFTQYKYRNNPGQDTRQVVMSAGFERKVEWFAASTMGLRAFYAHDEARRPLNPFTETTASRHTYGVRLVAQTDPAQRLSWQKAFSWSRRIDDDPFARATLVSTGRDDLFEAYVRASWRVSRSWSVQPYASYVYNRSNIDLYTFRKAEGGLMVRYEIR